jgi:hypothetical protein
MFGRYRSYTTYSEENGKLVPSIEPQQKDAKYHMTDRLCLVDRVTEKTVGLEGEKKLKTEALPNIVATKPLTNVNK